MKTCSRCQKNKNLEDFYYKKTEKRHTSWCRKCFETYAHQRWIERKRKLVELMGGKCQKCGYNQCLAALHFHHKNPSEKDADWKKISRWSWNKVMKEIKKCVLLCSNCHAEHHASQDSWLVTLVNDWDLFLNYTIKSSGQCPACQSDVYGTKYCSAQCQTFARKHVCKSKYTQRKIVRKSSGQCPTCQSNVYGTKYCSNECRGFAQRKVTRPSRIQLCYLINKHTWTDVGKKYGVSDNAVRKWAKRYDIS